MNSVVDGTVAGVDALAVAPHLLVGLSLQGIKGLVGLGRCQGHAVWAHRSLKGRVGGLDRRHVARQGIKDGGRDQLARSVLNELVNVTLRR